MSAPSDELLARHLEGLLEAEEAAALEAALAGDAALRARRDGLRAALDGVELPPVAPPAGLLDVVLARLELEGLVEPEAPGAAAEAGPALVEATLARLEAAGLVGAAPARRRARTAAAGAALLALVAAFGLGLAAGRSGQLAPASAPATEPAPSTDAPERRPAAPGEAPGWIDVHALGDKVRLELQAAERELRERLLEVTAEAEQARTEARAAAERERQAVAALAAERARGAAELADAQVRAGAELAEARAAAQVELAAAVARLDAAERGRARLEVELAAARAPAAPGPVATGAGPEVVVDDARGVARWDSLACAWRAVDHGVSLPAGTVVRGGGPASAVVLGGVRYALRDGTFVVSGGRFEPVPGALDAPRVEGGERPLEQLVPSLLADFASGSPRARTEAQRQLTLLWRRLGDPGSSVLARVSDDEATAERAGVPPMTARGWEAWWQRARSSSGARRR